MSIEEMIRQNKSTTEFLDDNIVMCEVLRCCADQGVRFVPDEKLIELTPALFDTTFPGIEWTEVEILQDVFPHAAKKQTEYRGFTFETWRTEG